jgi:hypothetical protein
MLTKTNAILAAALILGTASAAMASQEGEDRGFVNPPILDGVNPAYHPNWFSNYATTRDAYKAYGFVRPSHPRTYER